MPYDSELSLYYHNFAARLCVPEGLAPEDCRCHGGGWILSEVDTWHHCPDHYTGQAHPDDADMDVDTGDPVVLEAIASADAARALDPDDIPF